MTCGVSAAVLSMPTGVATSSPSSRPSAASTRTSAGFADNDVALVLLSRLTLRTARLRSRSVVRPERQAQSIKEIEALGRVIKKRGIEAARRAAKAHVDHAASSALRRRRGCFDEIRLLLVTDAEGISMVGEPPGAESGRTELVLLLARDGS